MYFQLNLLNKTKAEFKLALAAIPPGITTLDLRYNYLGEKTGSKLALAIAAIPAGTKTLDLEFNRLGNKTGAELALAFAAIPATVRELILSYNNLGDRTGAELVQVLAAIPAGITTLVLSANQLYYKKSAELALAFAAIPAGVTTLDLGGNGLDHKTGAGLALAFAAIPASVTTLDLHSSDLGNKMGAALALAFAAIPAGVTTLNLHSNYLGNKTGAELALAFAAIPAGVTTLDLGGNDLDNKTSAELALALTALPSSVTTINLGGALTLGKLSTWPASRPNYLDRIAILEILLTNNQQSKLSAHKINQEGKSKETLASDNSRSEGTNKTPHHTKPPESSPLFKPHIATKNTHQNRPAEKRGPENLATAKSSIPHELISDDKEEMFLLGQFHQLDHKGVKKNSNLAFDYYMCAARLGHAEALTLLDHLGDEMGTEKQLELSQLYETFFRNDEKADYWRTKAAEKEDFNFNM